MRRLPLVAAALGGYVLGTIPSADLASRAAGAGDLRQAGSGNPGAANAISVLGRSWGSAVLAADISKGALACLLGGRLAGDLGSHVGGTSAVIGHCFPANKGFRGGKGVAASVGQCLITFPAYVPIDLSVALLTSTAGWKRRAYSATAVASAAWVGGGILWWKRGWPNAWGPRPGPSLPVAAAASSAVILSRFAAARATS
ncbi:MAG: glycerol-3-phosphate acyltransferase [Acidimicrobiales bacterium]